MKFLLLVVLLGVSAMLIYQATVPSPRLTFGDAGRLYDPYTPARFSPDGKNILAPGYRPINDPARILQFDHVLKLWDVATGKVIREYEQSNRKASHEFRRVGFSHDGKHVFACGQDLELVMWETESGKEVRAFSENRKPINCFRLTADGSQVLTASGLHLMLWDVATGKLLKKVSTHEASGGYPMTITEIDFSKDGKYLVLNGGATFISIWSFPELEMIYLSTNFKEDLLKEKPRRFPLRSKVASRSFVLAPDGQGMLYADNEGKIIELDLASAKEKKRFAIEADLDIHVLVLSPKHDKIMTTGFHGQTVVYSFPECKELKRMPGYGRVQFSPDGKTALTFTKNGRMMLWDLEK